jgi:hypothetical protein
VDEKFKGSPPYKVRWLYELASRYVTDSLKLSNDKCARQRIKDFIIHIKERQRHSGALFQDRDRQDLTPSQFARGIYYAEMAGIELYRKHDQLGWFLDGLAEGASPYFSEPRDLMQKYQEIRGTEAALAFEMGYDWENPWEEVERRLRRMGKWPPRERRKPGRKLIGDRAMTTAERVRRHRAKFKTPAPHRRVETAAADSCPLSRTAAVTPSSRNRYDSADPTQARRTKKVDSQKARLNNSSSKRPRST